MRAQFQHISPSPLPERKYSFGMGILPLPFSEPKDHFGMFAVLPALLVLKKKSNFGFQEPLFLPDSEDDFKTQVPVSLLLHAKDLSVLPIPDEGPFQTSTHQPTEVKEPIGSSSKKV